jgi:hypothetical protein
MHDVIQKVVHLHANLVSSFGMTLGANIEIFAHQMLTSITTKVKIRKFFVTKLAKEISSTVWVKRERVSALRSFWSWLHFDSISLALTRFSQFCLISYAQMLLHNVAESGKNSSDHLHIRWHESLDGRFSF